MDRYAVVGNPIAHSKSPIIHKCFAEQFGDSIEYEKMLVAPNAFAEEVSAFFALGGSGLNVTVPFKEEAFKFADALTERGRLAKAINTLALQEDGSILGDNTDGAGFMLDLERLGWSVAGKRILVLGAGGAVRGILHPLLLQQPQELIIANRTVSKAENLVADFSEFGAISALSFTEVSGPFDLIINGTSSSLSGDMPAIANSSVSSNTLAYDLMYANDPTVFMAWASSHGAQATSDGLGMLVGQAAESYRVWRNKTPDITPVLGQLRNAFAEA